LETENSRLGGSIWHLVRAFHLYHNMVDGIMAEVHTRRKDHIVIQEARDKGKTRFAVFITTGYSQT
jgi:hypothetical protein